MRHTPLKWPEGWKRTQNRKSAKFDTRLDKATRELEWEIQRLGGVYPTITHNPLHMELVDPGVAVYFSMNKKERVFACDRWDLVRADILPALKDGGSKNWSS